MSDLTGQVVIQAGIWHAKLGEIERLAAELESETKRADGNLAALKAAIVEESRLLARVEALEGLVTEAVGVCDDLIAKTDVYLGINDAYKRHDLWEKKLQALAATEHCDE